MERELGRSFKVLDFSKPCWDARRLRRHWRKLSIRHHPDLSGDADAFRSVQRAYQVITRYMKQKQQQHRRPMTAAENRTAVQCHRQVMMRQPPPRQRANARLLEQKIVDNPMTRQQYDQGVRRYRTRDLQVKRMFKKEEDFNVCRFNERYQHLKDKKTSLQVAIVNPEPMSKRRSYATIDPALDQTDQSAYDWTRDAVLNHMTQDSGGVESHDTKP